MKNSRFKYAYRKTASKAHRLTGEILRTNKLFSNFQCFQEYPVNQVNPEYPSGREHFDWVVKDLRLVIEIMGRQHEVPVCFGGVSIEEATEAFHAQVSRDRKKADAAVAAGYTYITIPYNVTPTADYIMEQYHKNYNPDFIDATTRKTIVDWAAKYDSAKERYQESDRYQIDKDRAKLYRKAQYQRMKEYKKART